MRVRDLNPLRGLPNRGEILAWAMYDLANQSFTVLINTVFFSLFVRDRLASSPQKGLALWGGAVFVSNLMVAASGPFIGAAADHSRAKKRWLLGLTACCVALTIGLALPGSGGAFALWACLALYVGANFCFATAENFIGSFLPDIAPPGQTARVSAFGWTLGYVGALLVLPASLLIVGTDGVSAGEARAVFVFAAVWFAVCAAPTFLFVRERRAMDAPGAPAPVVRAALSRVRNTWAAAGRHGAFLRFLGVFGVYSCGTQTVIYFANIIARDQFAFSDTKLILFMLQLAFTAGVGALLAGALDKRLGPRGVVVATLALWVLSTLGAYAMPKSPAYEWAFWLTGNGVGLALGAIGTSSRALAALLTPPEKSAEFFGLLSTAYRTAGAVGPLAFGALAYRAGVGNSLLLVVAFFGAGIIGMLVALPRVVAPPAPSVAPDPPTGI